MIKDSKGMVYVLIELLEQMHNWSKEDENNLLQFNDSQFDQVKRELLDVTLDPIQYDEQNNRNQWILFLSKRMNDKKLFSSKKDIANFGEKLNVPKMNPIKSRVELLGTIIDYIASCDAELLPKLSNYFNSQQNNEGNGVSKKPNKTKSKGNYVKEWFDFYKKA